MRKVVGAPVFVVVLASLVTALAVSGCVKPFSGKPDNSKIVARVNKDVITESDLNRELAGRSRQDPAFRVTPESRAEQLGIMMNRKLIVQEAMEKGLARQDSFIRTIKAFWEQALIRDFVEYKKREMRDLLFVSDEDVQKYYKNMSKKATFKAIRLQDKKTCDQTYDKYMKDKDTTGWKVIGPVTYDEMAGNIIFYGFDIEKGQAAKLEDPPYFYVVEMTDLESVDVEPLDKIRLEVEKRVIAAKERKMFEGWLKEKRNSSKTIIYNEVTAR